MSSFQKQSASQYILNYIIDMIWCGKLKVGDKLPTERDFAQQIGVSRVPLREAVTALSVMGILEPRQGAGTYVSTYDPSIMGKVFYAYAVLDGTPLKEIVAVRRSLEAEAARSAAQNADEHEINRLQQALQDYDKALMFPVGSKEFQQRISACDFSFHRAVAEASHNGFLLNLLNTVTISFEILHQKSYHEDADLGQESANHFQTIHKQIYEAIASHDSEGAFVAMSTHLQEIESILSR